MQFASPLSCFCSTSFFASKDPFRSLSQLSIAPNSTDKLLLVDTLALVRKLEAQGFDAKQAEAITAAMTDILNDCLQNVSDSFVSKSELDQYNMMLGSACTKLQSDLQTAQEKRLSAIHRETEKLRGDIEKLHGEIRFEMDKVSAGQRLDLNLERGRIKEELANQSAETSNLTNKLDKEINALKMQLEGSKYDVIKYCIGTIISVYALGLGLLRIFK
ncbi:hypothetical protein GOP47_0028239 [Adiantum capillus-veneris]|nr:hypothetical protein GOP47_0028239 [Adiantum capillus-veneris]